MKQHLIRKRIDRILTSKGFTLVELAVVISVIAILAIIMTSSFSAIQARTNYSVIDKDMKAMDLAVKKYYAKNGAYPDTGDAWKFRARDLNNFIPGLSPTYYTSDLPDVQSGSKTVNTQNTYAYRSNGGYYRLIRYGPIPASEMGYVSSDRISSSCSTDRWGYWVNTANPCNVAP